MKIIYSILFVAILFLLCSISVTAQTTNPKVIKYVAPKYPAVAEEYRATGSVIVEVEINKSGQVTHTSAISGNKFLRKMAEKTSEQWIFSSDKLNEKRIVRITFEFHLDDKNKKTNVKFVIPYTLKIFASRTRIETLKTS